MSEEIILELLARVKALEQQIERTRVIESSIAVQGYVATTNATITTIATISIPSSTTVTIEIHVSARRTGGIAGAAEDGAGYVQQATYKNVAGTATLIGSVNADFTAESQAAWDVTFAVSGANVLIRVTGAADNNISWYCAANVYQISS